MKQHIYLVSFLALFVWSGCVPGGGTGCNKCYGFWDCLFKIFQKPKDCCSEKTKEIKDIATQMRATMNSIYKECVENVANGESGNVVATTFEAKWTILEKKAGDLKKCVFDMHEIAQKILANMETEANLIQDKAIRDAQLDKIRTRQVKLARAEDKLTALFAKLPAGKDYVIVIKQNDQFEALDGETKKFAPLIEDMDRLLAEIAGSYDAFCPPEATQ